MVRAMFRLARILDRAGALFAADCAVSGAGFRLSYAELRDRVNRLARGLLVSGLAPGDRVALIAPNSFRYLEINMACARAGLVLVPLNIRLANAEIASIIREADAKLVMRTSSGTPCDLPAVEWNDCAGPGADNDYEALIRRSSPLDQATEGALDDIAQIFFTSGTTGEPKGVCLTHGNLVTSALDAIIIMDLVAEDVWLHASPMFHLVDAFAVWAVPLVGGRHVFAHFDPDSFGAIVARERITKSSLPPTLLDMIALSPNSRDADFGSLRLVSYGGSPMPAPVYERCSAALKCNLLQAYGITEVSGVVCHQLPGDMRRHDEARRKSVGRPAIHVDVRIIDDGDQTLAAGEIGEIAVRGPRVMIGYWRRPAETDIALRGGWYHTGDLGVADDEGRLTIVGRKKDMVISGGENVYPAEVEDALIAHPDVVEAAVFGIPSDRWGEEVRAVVVLKPGAAASTAALIEHCRARIGGYKVPKAIARSIAPLPKTGPGKIAKGVVRERYLAGVFDVEA
jgi:long-chain acyl-CoA synthetase